MEAGNDIEATQRPQPAGATTDTSTGRRAAHQDRAEPTPRKPGRTKPARAKPARTDAARADAARTDAARTDAPRRGDGAAAGGPATEQVLAGIGPRLRALRRDRGLTLEALAGDTGISVSTLSRLESGRRRPTLDLLIPLARAHRVALDQLVAAPATGDPRVHLRPRHRERGNVLVPLTQYPGRVQVFKQVLAHREPKLVTHAGYEWLYVLAGELRLVLGEREFTLRPGEAAEFDTSEPHWFGPSGTEPVEILHLFGPHGDQAVVRTRPSAAP